MSKKIGEWQREVLLTREQLADRWGCCKETIKRMQRQGEIPAIMFSGKNIRYALADIEQIEQERKYRKYTMEGGNRA
jgi:excisionase family DNA binding protein